MLKPVLLLIAVLWAMPGLAADSVSVLAKDSSLSCPKYVVKKSHGENLDLIYLVNDEGSVDYVRTRAAGSAELRTLGIPLYRGFKDKALTQTWQNGEAWVAGDASLILDHERTVTAFKRDLSYLVVVNESDIEVYHVILGESPETVQISYSSKRMGDAKFTERSCRYRSAGL